MITDLQFAWLQEIGIDKRLLPPRRVAPISSPQADPASVSQPVHVGAMPRGQAPTPQPSANVQQGTVSQIAVVARAPLPEGWVALEERAKNCEACALHGGRTMAVFGSGPVESPDWMVIGEAPGERDDRVGLPFQGKAGELLHAMLRSVGADPRKQVFYTNLIKCRPRGNRMPRPEEIDACLPYLHRQISLLAPRRILVVGRLAAQALLGGEAQFEAHRGAVHRYATETNKHVPLVVTYHPASLLSRPQQKAAAWRDLNLAAGALQTGPA